jgi:hypothetical protein
MPCAADPPKPGLWASLSRAWLQARTDRPADPRRAEDAGMAPASAPRALPPMAGAWLR